MVDPRWLGDSLFLANVIGISARAVMIVLAWAVERFVLRKLVNQEAPRC
jgi:branched-chain amino acid transport system permease protein